MDSPVREVNLIDESDRGAVIVAAAMLENDLDEVLEDILKRNGLSRKHIRDMFDLNGPLSSLSSKALVCYGFGIISRDVFDDLTQIRKLRNRFAHSPNEVDFLSSEVEDHVAEIKCCVEVSKGYQGKMFKGRGKQKVASERPHPALKDWELRSKGFVKYTKSVFCVGVAVLRVRIRERYALRMCKTEERGSCTELGALTREVQQ